MQRSSQEYIIMSMSFGAAIAITPFTIARFLQHEWLVAFVDLAMVLGMFMLGAYVYLFRKIGHTGILLSAISLTGMCSVIYLKGPDLVFWAYPTMVGLYFVVTPGLALILGMIATLVLVPVLSTMDLTLFGAVLVTLLVNNLFAFIFSSRMHKQSDQLSNLVRLDALTGIGNRRALDEKMEEIMVSVSRIDQPVSLLVLDVDHFKRVNDSYGHSVGDRVLVNMTALISARIRQTDFIFRYGGEEFVVLTPGADITAASILAEEFRIKVEATELLDDAKVTVSLGVAELHKDESASDWLRRADKVLYQAKENGRNKVCVAR